MGHVLVRVFAGKAYIRQGSITQIVKSIRKSSMRGYGLISGCRRFPAALPLEHDAQNGSGEQRGGDGADERRDAGHHQAVEPVVVHLVANGQQLVGDAGAEVARLVHGEAGHAAQAHAHGPDEQPHADSQREQVVARLRCDREDAREEDEGVERLDAEIAHQVVGLGRGVGREDVADGDAVDLALGSTEIICVDEPCDACARNAAEHLGDGEGHHAAPGDEADDRLAKGHGGVHAHAAEDEQADADAKRPSGDREHVAGVAVLAALERDIAVHADAEDNHEGGRGEFGEDVVDHEVPFDGRFV